MRIDKDGLNYTLERWKMVYTSFFETLERITTAQPGNVADFVQVLQRKIDEKFENETPPDLEQINAIIQPG